MAAVYVVVDRQGTGRNWGDGVQHQRTSRSADLETLAFVVTLFALLLVLSVVLGSPIA